MLISHSQSRAFPLQIALLDPAVIKAKVLSEPRSCENAHLNNEQVSKMASIPMLIVYGDHLTASTELPGKGTCWRQCEDECNVLISRLRASERRADMNYLPEIGINGNSHMMMLDKNNLDVAELSNKWLKKNANE